MENDRRLSIQLSHMLRHDKSMLKHMDEEAFVEISKILEGFRGKLNRQRLEKIVAEDRKGRYEILGEKIRAVNGHSVAIPLIGERIEPPSVLYHLTSREAVPSIMATGLDKRTRIYIHFHPELPKKAGWRNTLLIIDPPKDFEYFRTPNGYIVCRDTIPPGHIRVEE